MNDQELLIEDLRLGIDAEAFLNSEIGRYLKARADQERHEAIEEFRNLNPITIDEVRRIQNRIWRAESFLGWLVEAIQNGRYAEQELTAA